MTKEETFSTFLQKISQNAPKDAVQLRACSDSIIAKWINLKFEYPHDMIDPFVGIESEMENYIDGSAYRPPSSEHECKKAYAFYIGPFMRSLSELQSFFEESR